MLTSPKIPTGPGESLRPDSGVYSLTPYFPTRLQMQGPSSWQAKVSPVSFLGYSSGYTNGHQVPVISVVWPLQVWGLSAHSLASPQQGCSEVARGLLRPADPKQHSLFLFLPLALSPTPNPWFSLEGTLFSSYVSKCHRS